MLSPGSITNSVPDPDKAIRLQRDVQRNAQEQDSAQSLGQSQVGKGGLSVTDGGSIIVTGGGSIVVDSGGTITLPTGTLSAANVTATAALSAGTTIAAGGAITGASVAVTGPATVGTDLGVVNVNASGQVVSASAFKSPGSFAYHVVTGYQAMWINNDGTIGVSASTRDSKKDLIPLSDIDPLLSLKPMLGRYVWDAEDEPLKQFLIAEEVYEAGFGPDVAPLDENGAPLSINYSQLVPALIATVQALNARLKVLEPPTA
jgi:hypothetical protein